MHYIRKGIPLILLLLFILPTVNVMAEEQINERIYYILVDRYVNGNNENDIEIDIENDEAYHGGDLQGITEKIPSLNELGISTINLSPIMVAKSYHGFDPIEHQSVDPQFGDIADLQQLVTQAHEIEMKVIMDFPLTNVAQAHNWADQGTDWVMEPTKNQLGQELPALDLNNQEVQQYFLETVVYWMKTANIDGFHFYVNEQTPNDFIEQLRQRVQSENEQAVVILDGNESMDGMQHAFQKQAVDVLKQPGESLETLINTENTGVHYMESVLTPRFSHESVQAGFNPVTRWKLASTLLYTLPGAPFVYQGVEVPMDNGVAEPDHRMADLNKEDEELVQHLEKLAEIRESSTALKQGDMELIAQAGAMTVYKRSDQNQTMYVAINNDIETKVASLEEIGEDMQLRGLLEDNIVRVQNDGTHKIILERETSNIFILEEDTGFNWFFISMVVVILGGFIAFIVAVGVKNRKMRNEKD
ncbi:alpha-amylase family glycosyl hydrolase [Gracilibacillus massiliensis]|uniref:alpha-amylase family glycosyl hydrolase n=1 Tax=Gracilibacillus massiliensis TaxID=1564956 RepID=UPI00071DFD11|nr:alpha-amylase family glycosyl hydrolase [Gracilibacillus massiliensis]